MNLTRIAIRHEMEQRGVSVEMLARHLGVSPSHIRRVLNGERRSATLLTTIARVVPELGAPVRDKPRELTRLIDAASHIFFLRRGYFEADIIRNSPRLPTKDPDERRLK